MKSSRPKYALNKQRGKKKKNVQKVLMKLVLLLHLGINTLGCKHLSNVALLPSFEHTFMQGQVHG